MGYSPEVTKIIVLVVLVVSTFLFSMLPLLCLSVIRRQSNSTRRRYFDALMSLLSCYAAGVFLATCLLDLFPDVQEKLSNYMDRAGLLTAYPVAEFIMTCGLFLILIVEQMVLTFSGGDKRVVEEREPLLPDGDNCDDYTNHSARSQEEDSGGDGPPSSIRTNRSGEYVDVRILDPRSQGSELGPPGVLAEEHHYTGRVAVDAQSDTYHDPNSHSTVRSLILLTALSLHSVFEGLAVGLQSTTKQVLQIFAALALHKSILAFSLGLNLSQSHLSIGATIRSNLFFSITSPLGIGIGIAVMDLSSANSQPALLANVILQGLACGTFLYIVFFEVLPHEFNSQNKDPSRLLKVLFLIFGNATVAGILFVDPTVVRPVCQKGAQPVGHQRQLRAVGDTFFP